MVPGAVSENHPAGVLLHVQLRHDIADSLALRIRVTLMMSWLGAGYFSARSSVPARGIFIDRELARGTIAGSYEAVQGGPAAKKWAICSGCRPMKIMLEERVP